MHRSIPILVVALLACSTAQAKPNDITKQIEKTVTASMEQSLCGKDGQAVKTYKIKPAQCRATCRWAAKRCMGALHRIPFYQLLASDEPIPQQVNHRWGLVIGNCVGISFMLKYKLKNKKIP